ncbi:MAG: ABC transporter permease [Spirochaetales bacterium]|nr:ABC transporter permease [Spirochaetales bacterium]
MEILLVALRNVFRNRRRTVLNVVAIAVGVVVIVNLHAWILGFTQTVYNTQMDIDTAQVQILNKDYEAEKARLPLDLEVPKLEAVETLVRSVPGVQAVGARIDYAAELTNGVTAVPVQARGVDPQAEAQLTIVAKNLVQGHWFSNENDVMVGSGLAKKLGLKVGDPVFLTAVDQWGVRNLVSGTVGGVFSLGYELFDDRLIFTTLGKSRELLSLGPHTATRVVVKFSSSFDTAAEAREVRRALGRDPALAGLPLRVYEWKEFAQTVVSTIDTRVRIMTFLLEILVLLVAVGILNSLSMSVQERFREIGTLRALGMNRRKLTRLFLAEGFFLGALGGLCGAVLAAALGWFFATHGVDVRTMLPKDLPIPFTSLLLPRYSPWDFVLAVLLSGFVAVLGAWLPARRAGRLRIVDALGSHL